MDFEHIRTHMISFGDIGIMLYELDNAHEVLETVQRMIENGKLGEKLRTNKSKNYEKFGIYIFIASCIFILVGTIFSNIIPYHLISPSVDLILIYMITGSIITVLFVRYIKKDKK